MHFLSNFLLSLSYFFFPFEVPEHPRNVVFLLNFYYLLVKEHIASYAFLFKVFTKIINKYDPDKYTFKLIPFFIFSLSYPKDGQLNMIGQILKQR